MKYKPMKKIVLVCYIPAGRESSGLESYKDRGIIMLWNKKPHTFSSKKVRITIEEIK